MTHNESHTYVWKKRMGLVNYLRIWKIDTTITIRIICLCIKTLFHSLASLLFPTIFSTHSVCVCMCLVNVFECPLKMRESLKQFVRDLSPEFNRSLKVGVQTTLIQIFQTKSYWYTSQYVHVTDFTFLILGQLHDPENLVNGLLLVDIEKYGFKHRHTKTHIQKYHDKQSWRYV